MLKTKVDKTKSYQSQEKMFRPRMPWDADRGSSALLPQHTHTHTHTHTHIVHTLTCSRWVAASARFMSPPGVSACVSEPSRFLRINSASVSSTDANGHGSIDFHFRLLREGFFQQSSSISLKRRVPGTQKVQKTTSQSEALCSNAHADFASKEASSRFTH